MSESSQETPSLVAERAGSAPIERIFELGAAADTLFRAGLFAQSYRLALEQLSQITQLDPSARIAGADGNGHAAVANGRVTAPSVDASLNALQALGAPADDVICNAQQRHALRHAIASGAAWLAAQGVAAKGPLRLPRAVWLAGIAALLAVIISLGVPRALAITASSSYAAEFDARNIADGSLSSEWLLPDAQTGWVELRLRSARALHNVRVVNAINRHYLDRATRSFRLELFRGDQRVESFTAEFPAVGVGDRTRAFPVAAKSVDRIMVRVDSWHGYGGGLAEIQLE